MQPKSTARDVNAIQVYSKLNIMQLIAAKDRVEAVEAPEKCTILGGKSIFLEHSDAGLGKHLQLPLNI